jgi:hypothetical protein
VKKKDFFKSTVKVLILLKNPILKKIICKKNFFFFIKKKFLLACTKRKFFFLKKKKKKKMEPPTFTSQLVEHLSRWTDIDVISSYKEICKQLDIRKLREECEVKERRKLRESSEQLSQSVFQQSQQSLSGGNNNVFTTGNGGDQLKHQKDEPALHAEEMHLIRIKNALWRRMGPSVCVGKRKEVVSLKSLEW